MRWWWSEPANARTEEVALYESKHVAHTKVGNCFTQKTVDAAAKFLFRALSCLLGSSKFVPGSVTISFLGLSRIHLKELKATAFSHSLSVCISLMDGLGHFLSTHRALHKKGETWLARSTLDPVRAACLNKQKQSSFLARLPPSTCHVPKATHRCT